MLDKNLEHKNIILSIILGKASFAADYILGDFSALTLNTIKPDKNSTAVNFIFKAIV